MALKSRKQQTSDVPKTRKPGSGTKGRSFAIYGRAGSGKTTLAGTFPGPILLGDVNDRGDDSVSDIDNMEVVDIHSVDDLEEVYWALHSGGWEGKFKTFVLDTVTQLQQIIITEIIEAKGKSRKSNKRAGDWGSMTKQDWGTVSGEMKDWITKFRDLPINVVFLAQDRVFNVEEEDATDGLIEPEIGPRLSPATNKHLCAAVHVIGNTFIRTRIIKKNVPGKKKPVEKERIEYCLRIGPNSVYTTKVRKSKAIDLPDLLVDPTYDEIIEIIEGDE